MNTVAFEAYWPLWLLVLLPLVWWSAARSRTSLGTRLLTTAAVLRSGALLFVVLALVRPVWTAGSHAVSIVYAIDVSRSVAPEFIRAALNFIDEANRSGAPAHAGYVAFAEQARTVAEPHQVPEIAVTAMRAANPRTLYQGATNLELALDQALLGFEPDAVKRLVVFSDGNQTAGDAWRALPRLQALGVRLFAFAAAPRAQRDAWIESLEAPQALRRDEPALLRARVVSQGEAAAKLLLAVGGREVAAQPVKLARGMNVVPLRVRIPRQGLVTVTAEVRAPGDEAPENDGLQQALWVAPRPRVLYVEGAPDSARYLRDALTREGLEIAVAPRGELPATAEALAAYDAVILSDLGAGDLDAARMAALEAYVRDAGGGLVFAGGENTYGQSGYSGTPLERVLPVEFKAQEKRKDLALVLCIDRSYSMKGRPMELAKAGARAALDMLEEQHRFAVVAFDSQPHEAVALQYVRSKRKAEDLIDRIQASGQTNIYPALASAWRMLQNVDAKRKHIILLSDGDTAPADFERLLKRITDANVTVSTIAIGRSGDPELMARVAHWGRGKAYVAEDVAQVPQIFVEDTQNVSRSTLIEEPFKPVVRRSIEALRGLDFAAAPPLLGFASTKAKDGAEVFLATDAGAPVLARWQYGLGKAVVFTSDVKNRWSVNWLQWDGYGKFWTQLTRDTLRRSAHDEVRFDVVRQGEEARIALRLMTSAGGWQNRLEPLVRVRSPDGAVHTVALRQTGPGHYAGDTSVVTAAQTPYSFELLEGGGVARAMARRAGMRQLYYPYPDEYRSYPPDVELLAGLAEHTGGKLAPSAAELFDLRGDRGTSRSALWPWLAAIALALYLCDIAVRRAPWLRRPLDHTRLTVPQGRA